MADISSLPVVPNVMFGSLERLKCVFTPTTVVVSVSQGPYTLKKKFLVPFKSVSTSTVVLFALYENVKFEFDS